MSVVVVLGLGVVCSVRVLCMLCVRLCDFVCRRRCGVMMCRCDSGNGAVCGTVFVGVCVLLSLAAVAVVVAVG